jgi:hypothetical protein
MFAPSRNGRFDIGQLPAMWKGLPHRFPWIPWSILLPAFFLAISILDLGRHYLEVTGVDARIYIRAATAFRLGENPWQAFVAGPGGSVWHFAALPPTVQAFVPLSFLPENLAVWLVLWASLLSAFWIVRFLKLPIWWLLFPPLVQGIWAANPQIILLAMLLSGSSVLKGLAPMLKIYALAPLVGERWIRALLLAAIFLVVSYLIAPELWTTYFTKSGSIASRLLDEAKGGYSAYGNSSVLLVLAIGGLGLLAVVDIKAAGWFAGPALVPASQFHLSTMAMPIMARDNSLILTMLFAMPIRGLPSATVAIYGAWRCYAIVRARRLAESDR